ncbi:hypothetical protein Q3G72_027227 [Acer saccharum]|nr:hypothetical protein Q3G72_027227 [Acer saccharum]
MMSKRIIFILYILFISFESQPSKAQPWVRVDRWPYFTAAPNALYNPNSTVCSTDLGITAWINVGLSAKKIVLLLPCFGLSWTLVNPKENGIGAPATGMAKGVKTGQIAGDDNWVLSQAAAHELEGNKGGQNNSAAPEVNKVGQNKQSYSLVFIILPIIVAVIILLLGLVIYFRWMRKRKLKDFQLKISLERVDMVLFTRLHYQMDKK